MARTDLPYLPLYVQDFMTDEKLMECSASATGVYIRILCILHKCKPYGKILLRQKGQQNVGKTSTFAELFADRFARHLPYTFAEIVAGLEELISEDVLQINDMCLSQKRMVSDAELSLKRSESGKKGAFITNRMEIKNMKKNENFAAAKRPANTDIDIDIEIKDKRIRGVGERKEGFNTMTKPDDVNGLPNVKVNSAIEQMRLTQQKDIDEKQVLGLWNVFKIQKLTGKKFYVDEEAVQDYFLNWLKTQNFKNGNQENGLKKSKYEQEIEDRRKNFKPTPDEQ